ncbi:MAG: hypothetical protein FJ125_17555, partial [Deltaproteobacteria bacterium]|nr:hypothetical protein [Deltaproteobacteria bacterium]
METSANRSERSAEAGHEQPATWSRVARQLKGQAYDEQMATLAPPLPQGEEQAMASASTEQQQT